MSLKRRVNNIENSIIFNTQEEDIKYILVDSKVLENKEVKFKVRKEENGEITFLENEQFYKELEEGKAIYGKNVIFDELSKEQLKEIVNIE